MISIKHSGSFKNLERFLSTAKKQTYTSILDKYGMEGVAALSLATPKDSAETANSWAYVITRSENSFTITWTNSNVVDDVMIAVILQYGHATNNGGYVQAKDYINPVMIPIFERIAAEAWKEVTK